MLNLSNRGVIVIIVISRYIVNIPVIRKNWTIFVSFAWPYFRGARRELVTSSARSIVTVP